jgi:hypothetical protein
LAYYQLLVCDNHREAWIQILMNEEGKSATREKGQVLAEKVKCLVTSLARIGVRTDSPDSKYYRMFIRIPARNL